MENKKNTACACGALSLQRKGQASEPGKSSSSDCANWPVLKMGRRKLEDSGAYTGFLGARTSPGSREPHGRRRLLIRARRGVKDERKHQEGANSMCEMSRAPEWVAGLKGRSTGDLGWDIQGTQIWGPRAHGPGLPSNPQEAPWRSVCIEAAHAALTRRWIKANFRSGYTYFWIPISEEVRASQVPLFVASLSHFKPLSLVSHVVNRLKSSWLRWREEEPRRHSLSSPSFWSPSVLPAMAHARPCSLVRATQNTTWGAADLLWDFPRSQGVKDPAKNTPPPGPQTVGHFSSAQALLHDSGCYQCWVLCVTPTWIRRMSQDEC